MSPIPSTCPYCGSEDHMLAFRRDPRLGVFSMVIPGLRRLYCRACCRHFPAVLRRSRE